MCPFCRENDQTDINYSSETKVFLRYVDDIVRTVRGDKKELLDAVDKNIETSHQHARRIPNTRIDTESLVWN